MLFLPSIKNKRVYQIPARQKRLITLNQSLKYLLDDNFSARYIAYTKFAFPLRCPRNKVLAIYTRLGKMYQQYLRGLSNQHQNVILGLVLV